MLKIAYSNIVDLDHGQLPNSSESQIIRSRVRIMIKSQESLRILPVKKIVFVEAASSYCILHTLKGEKICVSKSLKQIADLLQSEPKFIRVHRSYLVNIQYVKSLNRFNELEFIDYADKVLVSRRRREDVIDALSDICLS